MIGQSLKHYRISEKLGAGGMGVVYRARDSRLERDVALKVLPPGMLADDNARRRFGKEALALARLNHPNIATVHDFDSQDGVDFLVMELIPGTSLDKKPGPLAEKEVLGIGSQLARGLAAAHAEGVIHRDLKPSNLKLLPDGRLKILDFGLARLFHPAATDAPTDAKTGIAAGTLAYMAPEQIESDRSDERSDIYSAGVVLYELATGRRPFSGDTAGRLMHAILTEVPSPPIRAVPNISPALDNIIVKALDKNPDRRYQSARELLVDLERSGAPAAASMPGEPRTRRMGRRGVVAIAAAIVLAAAVSMLVLQRVTGGSSRPTQALAVLPLVNVSGDPNQEYFADGLTYELIAQLGKISALRVTSRTSAVQYKGSKKTLGDIARELKVGKVLQGSVARAGDRARINLQLIDTAAGRQLWSQFFDRDVRNISQLQSEVARAVADEVEIRLTRKERASLAAPVRPVRHEAHEEYLKGVFQQMKKPPDQSKAKEHLERAIQIDPTYAPAYTALGEYYTSRAFFINPLSPMEVFPKLKELALKALELDDAAAQAYVQLGIARLHHEWNFAGAEEAFKNAIQANPSFAPAHHWSAHHLLVMDRTKESMDASQRAAELDPVNINWASCYGWHCLYARQYDLAIEQSLRALRMNPNHFLAHVYLGRAYEEKQRFAEAIAEMQTAVTLSGGSPSVLAALGHIYATAGDREEALKIVAMLEERARSKYVSPYDFAVVYAGLGDHDRAFEWLEKAFFERATWILHLKWDERFAPMRSDRRFNQLLQRIGLPLLRPATPAVTAG